MNDENPYPPEAPWPEESWEYDPDLPHTWPGEEKARWSITNDRLADWALAKYARAEQEMKRLTELAEEEIARIRQRLEEATSSPQHDMDFFGYHLTAYHSRLQEAGKAGKTYKLLNGDLTSRALPPRVVVTDVEQVQSYDAGLVRTKVEPEKRLILDRMKAGEVIPGCELVVGEESFRPKPGKHEQPAWLPRPEEEAA